MSRLLKKVWLFSGLDETALRALNEELHPARFAAGENLCCEGESGDRMFIIESGEVAVLKEVEGEQPIEVTVLRAGDVAGEMGLFGQERRSATLRALTDSKVWTLRYEAFDRLLGSNPSVAKGLLSHMSGHLVRETSTVARLLARDIEHGLRVAFFHASPYRNALYTRLNRFGYAMRFFSSRLELETVPLASNFPVVVISANDCADADVIRALSALGVEMIALRCAGHNNVDVEACERFGISVARVPAYSPYAVAEHAVALMMALNRKTHRAHVRVRDGNFSLNGLVGFDMHGRVAGVIGTGRIGTCLLSILHGFGCELIAHTRTPKVELTDRYGVRFLGLDDVLAQADIISLHAPLTPDTYHLIDADTIAKMKTGVMLVNTARGALIDTEALIAGLKSGKIGYAGLDVYEEEAHYFYRDLSDSVIADDALARLTTFHNVMVTGHQGSLTDVAQENLAQTTIENIREYELGKRGSELTHAVTSHASQG